MLFLLWIILIIPAVMWESFVIVKLWGWFVVPLGIVPIGIWHAAGLAVLLDLFTKNHPSDDDEVEKAFAWWCLKSVFLPLFAIMFGMIFYSLMI